MAGGHMNRKNLEKIGKTAAIAVNNVASGKVITFAYNPNLRSYWHTTSAACS